MKVDLTPPLKITIGATCVTAILLLVGCAQTRFEQSYQPDWTPMSVDELTNVEDRLEKNDAVSFSDYYSFIGEDEYGRIAFALDNNRRRTDGKYQADHSTFYYDTESGFEAIPGYGTYSPKDEMLRSIPDSEFFTFKEEDGVTTVTSEKTDLELQFGQISKVFDTASERTLMTYGLADAQLKRGDRVLKGRLIHERFAISEFRFNFFNWTLLSNFITNTRFHGLYLFTEDGEDIYLRATNFKADWVDTPEAFGFFGNGEHNELLQNVKIRVLKRRQGPGLFRLPTKWGASWGSDNSALLEVTEVSSDVITNWFVGGFAMAYVEGNVTLPNGDTKSVSGFAELILP